MLRTTSRARPALVVAALALALLALAFATTAGAATNLIANGTFEGANGAGSLSGWQASGGTLALVAGNGGGHAARVTLSSGAKQVYDYTTSKPVKSATAGSPVPAEWADLEQPGRADGLPAPEGVGRHHRKRPDEPAVLPDADGRLAELPGRQPHRHDQRGLAGGERDRASSGRRRHLCHRQHEPDRGSAAAAGHDAAVGAPERGRKRQRAHLGDGDLVAVDRYRGQRPRRLPRLPGRPDRCAGDAAGIGHQLHRRERPAVHQLQLHRGRLRRGAQHLCPVEPTGRRHHPGRAALALRWPRLSGIAARLPARGRDHGREPELQRLAQLARRSLLEPDRVAVRLGREFPGDHPSLATQLPERRGRPVPSLERQRQGHHQRQPVPPVGRHRWGTHMGGTRGGHAQQLPDDGLRLLHPPPQPGQLVHRPGRGPGRRRLLRHQRRGVHAFHVLTFDARLVHLGDAESVP